MKSFYDIRMKLKLIKYISFISLIISATFIAFNDNKILGINILIISLLFEWKFYRCPHCKSSLDTRLDIYKNPYCPHCGKDI